MRRTLAVLALAVSVAGCSSTQPAPSPPPPAAAPPQPAPSAPPPLAGADDQCGARQAQALVGRQRSEIPVPLDPALQRVACTTCPVTLDFNPRRLNFFFDADTGVIKQVRCG